MSILQSLQNKASEALNLEKEILNQNFRVKTFGYRKFLFDGTSIGFCSREDWNNYFEVNFAGNIISIYEKEIKNIFLNNKSFCSRIGNPQNNSCYLQALYQHNIWNTLVIYKRSSNYIEGFYYCTEINEENIINYYLNNLESLDKFTIYLQAKMKNILMDKSYEQLLSKTFDPNILMQNSLLLNSNKILDQYKVQYNISNREMECIHLILKGKSMKEIASSLVISPRTVEQHIKNVKQKIGLGSKSELINFFENDGKNLLKIK